MIQYFRYDCEAEFRANIAAVIMQNVRLRVISTINHRLGTEVLDRLVAHPYSTMERINLHIYAGDLPMLLFDRFKSLFASDNG